MGYRTLICFLLLAVGLVNLLVGLNFLARLSRTSTATSAVNREEGKERLQEKAEGKHRHDYWMAADREPGCVRQR